MMVKTLLSDSLVSAEELSRLVESDREVWPSNDSVVPLGSSPSASAASEFELASDPVLNRSSLRIEEKSPFKPANDGARWATAAVSSVSNN